MGIYRSPSRPGLGNGGDLSIEDLPLYTATGGAVFAATLPGLTQATGPLAAFGGPVGLAISGGLMAATYLIGRWRKNQQQKVASTQVVNEAEPYLQQNLAAYLASSRTTSEQQQALQNFYTIWNQVVARCNEVGGSAGERCIEDRQEGSNPPWGGENWFERYLDPIRQDPNVVPDAQARERTVVDPATGEYTVIPGPSGGQQLDVPLIGQVPSWALAIGIAALGFALFGGSGK
jgi:hypothetical protein